MDYISNKVIVITGAASGFGKLTAEKLSTAIHVAGIKHKNGMIIGKTAVRLCRI